MTAGNIWKCLLWIMAQIVLSETDLLFFAVPYVGFQLEVLQCLVCPRKKGPKG